MLYCNLLKELGWTLYLSNPTDFFGILLLFSLLVVVLLFFFLIGFQPWSNYDMQLNKKKKLTSLCLFIVSVQKHITCDMLLVCYIEFGQRKKLSLKVEADVFIYTSSYMYYHARILASNVCWQIIWLRVYVNTTYMYWILGGSLSSGQCHSREIGTWEQADGFRGKERTDGHLVEGIAVT